MATHTPGDWKLTEGNMSCMVYALDETEGVNRFSALVQGGYSYHGRTHKDRTTEEELSANARLIAAAPDLLAALERLSVACLMRALRGTSHIPSMREEQVAAHEAAKAIAKAKGDA